MRYRLWLTSVAAIFCLALAGCDSSNNPSNPTDDINSGGGSGGGSGSSTGCSQATVGPSGGRVAQGTMTAQIDAVTWTAKCIVVNTTVAGIIAVAGTDNPSNAANAQILSFGSQAASGTYRIDASSSLNASLNVNGALWTAGLTTGSGTLALANSTSTTLTGTFQFGLAPLAGTTAAGTRVINNGVINITF